MVFSGLFLEDIGINNLILIHVNYWNFKKSEIFKNSSNSVHMVRFKNFVKLVSPSLLELKVTPSFCFAFKILDNQPQLMNICSVHCAVFKKGSR